MWQRALLTRLEQVQTPCADAVHGLSLSVRTSPHAPTQVAMDPIPGQTTFMLGQITKTCPMLDIN